MKIAVHASALSEPKLHGIGYYTYNILKSLSELNESDSYTLYSNKPFIWNLSGNNVEHRELNFPYGWSYLRFPFEMMNGKHDVAFIPKEMVPPFLGTSSVITVFDLMHLHFAEHITPAARRHFYLAGKFAFPRAAKILTISEDTKRDLVNMYRINPEKVIVTPLGYDKAIFKPRSQTEIGEVLLKYHIDKPYFINVSSYWWHRKNLLRLIRAFAASLHKNHCDHQLVITGKRGPVYPEMLRLCRELGVENRVHLLEYVPLEDLAILLSGADALLFPSLHEGFGLPILEAMASGCPVVASNVSAMPEAAGDAAILIDPLDELALEQAIDKLANDSDLKCDLSRRGYLQSAQFDWMKTAKCTLEVFRQVANKD